MVITLAFLKNSENLKTIWFLYSKFSKKFSKTSLNDSWMSQIINLTLNILHNITNTEVICSTVFFLGNSWSEQNTFFASIYLLFSFLPTNFCKQNNMWYSNLKQPSSSCSKSSWDSLELTQTLNYRNIVWHKLANFLERKIKRLPNTQK